MLVPMPIIGPQLVLEHVVNYALAPPKFPLQAYDSSAGAAPAFGQDDPRRYGARTSNPWSARALGVRLLLRGGASLFASSSLLSAFCPHATAPLHLHTRVHARKLRRPRQTQCAQARGKTHARSGRRPRPRAATQTRRCGPRAPRSWRSIRRWPQLKARSTGLNKKNLNCRCEKFFLN